jgi:hypothetical protein
LIGVIGIFRLPLFFASKSTSKETIVKKVWIVSFICILLAAIPFACQRPPKVEASGEANGKRNQNLQGELSTINLDRTFVIRIDNGMEQTVLVNESTSIVTPKGPRPIIRNRGSRKIRKDKTTNTLMRPLIGWEGSELTIAWTEYQGMKLATGIVVSR